MKILFISDSHGNHRFPLDADVDVICTLGDMSEQELLTIAKHYTVPILSVYGNNDSLRQYQHDFITHLDGTTSTINGVTFGGVGGIPIYSDKRSFYLKSEEQIEEQLFKMGKADIILSHANPMLPIINDSTNSNRGFFSFLRYMEFFKPSHWLHGHLHEESSKEFESTKIHCVYTTKILHF